MTKEIKGLNKIYDDLIGLFEEESISKKSLKRENYFILKNPIKIKLHKNIKNGIYLIEMNNEILETNVKSIGINMNAHHIKIRFNFDALYVITDIDNWNLEDFIQKINTETNSIFFPIYHRNKNLKDLISNF